MDPRYIAMQSLLALCEGSERSPEGQVGMWWWYQVGINMMGAREVAAAAAGKDGGDKCRRGSKGRLTGRSNSNEYT